MHLFLSRPELELAATKVLICVLTIEDAKITTIRDKDTIEMNCPC